MSNPRSLIKHYEAAYGEYAAQNLDVKEQEQVNNAEMSEMYDVNVREPVQAASLSGSNGHSTIVNDIKLNYKPALNASTARNIDNKTGSLTGKIPGGQLQGNIHSEDDEIPSSVATECSSADRGTNINHPVGVLMKEQEYLQEIQQKQTNKRTSQLVTSF